MLSFFLNLFLTIMKNTPQYNRILLKFSGEVLMSNQQSIDEQKLQFFVHEIIKIVDMGVEVGIVPGGGNIFRGLKGVEKGFDRVKGDYMGMLATIINSLALQAAFQAENIPSRVFTAFRVEPAAEYFNREKALKALENKEVVIFSGGTGNPFFSTDTASALRGVEMNANIIVKGTKVDGIYNADPVKTPDAQKYDQISFNEVYKQQLKVMDLTAFTMCKDNNLPIIVFNINEKDDLKNIILGKKIGTLVKN